jgi:PKD repeat protein
MKKIRERIITTGNSFRVFPGASRSIIFCSVFLAFFLFAPGSSWALDPGLPPGGNFDLSHWYLQLPTSNGILTGADGRVDSTLTSELMAGFTNDYFYTGADGAMVFRAPVTGARTIGSNYPRSELRELLRPQTHDTTINWLPIGTHTLDAQCQVLQLPSSKKVIIGQMFCYSSGGPAAKIYYDNGAVYGTVKTNVTVGTGDFKFPSVSVGLSNNISYKIRAVNGLVSIAINNTTNSLNLFEYDPDFATSTMYFKAGNYCQDNVGTDEEGAIIAFHSLTLSHAPSITNQPTSREASVGGSTTFSVSAVGNGALSYQWWFNATNNLNGKTDDSLTITNVSNADMGDYSVVVSDSYGSVTSSTATLTILSASFSASPTNGGAPLTVTFTDDSTGTATNRYWSFGDGATMNVTTTSLTHTYSFPGTTTVMLIVSNEGGSSTNTKPDLVVATSVDTVGDSVPDWWRAQYFGGNGTTTNADSSATADFDNDGINNLDEYLADTIPTNVASRLEVTGLTVETGGVHLTWIGGLSAYQYVEHRNSLAGTNDWKEVYTNIPPTSVSNTLFDTGAEAATSRFYRIKAWR